MNGYIPESFAQFEDDFKRKMENVLSEPFENEYECLSVLAENPERSVFIVREKNTGLKRIFVEENIMNLLVIYKEVFVK